MDIATSLKKGSVRPLRKVGYKYYYVIDNNIYELIFNYLQ
jgi:hypothetical protein